MLGLAGEVWLLFHWGELTGGCDWLCRFSTVALGKCRLAYIASMRNRAFIGTMLLLCNLAVKPFL